MTKLRQQIDERLVASLAGMHFMEEQAPSVPPFCSPLVIFEPTSFVTLRRLSESLRKLRWAWLPRLYA
jgi:hypothetical protein